VIPAVDLRTDYPRSPTEQLGGMDILTRAIDKAQAEIDGTLGDYIYWDCPMNHLLFDTLGLDAAQFLEAVRQARRTAEPEAQDFLKDARESPEDPGFLSDNQITDAVKSPQIDNEILSWVARTHMPDPQQILQMNKRLEQMSPSTPEAKRAFTAELAATGTGRTGITKYVDLTDLQEGRLRS